MSSLMIGQCSSRLPFLADSYVGQCQSQLLMRSMASLQELAQRSASESEVQGHWLPPIASTSTPGWLLIQARTLPSLRRPSCQQTSSETGSN